MDQLKVEWRKVGVWPYEVSSTGLVRNAKTLRVLKPMRTGTNRKGSQRSKVRFSTKPRVDFDVAHLVLHAFVGPRPHGMVAMHMDDDSTNNAVDNLRWGTQSDNARDCARKSRAARQVVGPEAVAEIARRRVAGERGADLAREFGISQQRVCDIYKGRTALL